MKKTNRKWRVEYDLAYDMWGSGPFTCYYYTKFGARLAMFYNKRIGSWGGTAVLHLNKGK